MCARKLLSETNCLYLYGLNYLMLGRRSERLADESVLRYALETRPRNPRSLKPKTMPVNLLRDLPRATTRGT